MGKKTGKRANYVTFGGQEIKELIDGREIGVSYSASNQQYYVMLPGDGRTKRKWLGRDLSTAVVRFRSIMAKLREEAQVFVSVPRNETRVRHGVAHGTEDDYERILREGGKPIRIVVSQAPSDMPIEEIVDQALATEAPSEIQRRCLVDRSTVDHREAHNIEWLKEQLLDPATLARKTGIEEFASFHQCMARGSISLKTLYDNYTKSKRYSRIIDEDTRKKTLVAWKLFLQIVAKKTVEELSLDDVKAFESYLHEKKYSDKTIHHYKGNVTKIFRYNLQVFEDTTAIQRILDYFLKWEDLNVNSGSPINATMVAKKDFLKLYGAADLQMQAVMMLCLNSATYLREAARFLISDIDLSEQTLMARRAKTGQCRKFCFLWDRTTEVLREYLGTRKDASDVLFLSYDGTAYKGGAGLRTRWYDLRREQGLLRVEFQHLRDTFSTVAHEVGISEYHINMVLGHSNGRTSERYTHRRIHNELQEACLRVEKEFFGGK